MTFGGVHFDGNFWRVLGPILILSENKLKFGKEMFVDCRQQFKIVRANLKLKWIYILLKMHQQLISGHPGTKCIFK